MYRIEDQKGNILLNNLDWHQVITYFQDIWNSVEVFGKNIYDKNGIKYKVGHDNQSWFIEPI